MNTYEGDLVLDPFVGSGTTAVAAVRTGRHYIGYDTDAGYVETAQGRLADERAATTVRVLANDGRATDPLRGGWSSKELAKSLLTAAGFSQVDDKGAVVPGVAPTLRALDASGRTWWFEVVGGRTSNRPGAQRIELLWRAIAKGAIVRESVPSDGFVVLTVGMPAAVSGGRALGAVTGPLKPVAAVVDMLADNAAQTLAALAQ